MRRIQQQLCVTRTFSATAFTGCARPLHLAVQELGDTPHGQPIVFLHGLLGSGTNFRSIAQHPRFSGHRVLTVDLRNHGKSPHDDTPMTFEMLAGDVASTLAAVGVLRGSKCMLVGHSLGGKVAMTLELLHPGIVSRLVVMDIAPVAYNTANPQWLAVNRVVSAANAIAPVAFSRRAEIDKRLAVTVPDPGMRSFVLQNLVMDSAGVYHWRLNLPTILESMSQLATFFAPDTMAPSGVSAHFIAGELSHYIQPSHHDTILSLFPNSHFHTIHGAGHWIHADKPAEVIELLGQIASGNLE